MLSTKLLQRVEAHWESIATAVIAQTRVDPNTPHHQDLDEQELHTRARDLVHNLGTWLTSNDEAALASRYEQVGRARFHDATPLSEVVYKLHLIELKTVDYIQHANTAQSAMEIFGELEMLRALHRYFAIVVHAVVRGYENAAVNQWKNRACA